MHRNLLLFLEEKTNELAGQTALGMKTNIGANELTFKGISSLARRLGSYLIDLGIEKGDKIALLSESMLAVQLFLLISNLLNMN